MEELVTVLMDFFIVIFNSGVNLFYEFFFHLLWVLFIELDCLTLSLYIYIRVKKLLGKKKGQTPSVCTCPIHIT